MEKMTKKEMYGKGLPNVKTYIDGCTAIKPYWYIRGTAVHVRFILDKAIELSDSESARLKEELSANPSDKQEILKKAWSFYADCIGKPIIHDGIALADKKMEELRKNGYKNK